MAGRTALTAAAARRCRPWLTWLGLTVAASPSAPNLAGTERLHLPDLLSLVAMSSGSDAPDFSGWRVGELRRYLHERGVSTAGALELLHKQDASSMEGAARRTF